MKTVLLSILTILCLFFSSLKSNAMTFEEGFSQSSKTPVVVLVYADWADGYPSFLQTYQSIQQRFVGLYNFTELNIASKDAKFFNSKFHIYPKLPYVLMFKDNGKVSRYIQNTCSNDANCLADKLKSFIQ